VVTSKQTEQDIRKYDVPVVRVDNVPYRWMKLGKRPKRLHEYLILDAKLKKTYDFLNTHAKVVLFYELFELKYPEWLTKPKKVFLTHGNMLKSYMTSHPKRLENIAHYDYMAALSPYMKAKFITEGVPSDKLVDIGIARTDELLASLSKKSFVRQQVTQKLALNPKKPIILYAPTFWGESSIHHTGLEILEYIDDSFTLLFRPHPQTPGSILKKYQKIIKSRNNIHLIDHTVDTSLTDLLVSSDATIIDRSSIALEALLTDTPIVFAYDSSKQEETSDYESIKEIVDYSQKILLGDKARVNETIKSAIYDGIKPAIWNNVRKRVWFQPNGGATEAIKTFITSQID
ncbi:MAG TPA: CDP-glycerol glycerophosphotransferase family protein, partial [Candidatus Saccharimonadales bacterium]